jgi:hypothetical protein
MKKYTNVQVGQRVEHSDLAFGLLDSQRQAIQSTINDMMVGSDAPTKNFVLSGFGASASTTTITVTRGTAIVGFRDGAQTQFGMLLSDGDATRNIDIASLPDNVGDPLYGVYVRFNFEDSDFANRQFWNPLAVTPVETVRNVPTRKSENWSLAVELVSPGPEWLKIYEVEKNGSSLTLTDVRPLFFDSNATGAAITNAQWGGGNDRNANRGLYGVRGLYRFIKAVQRQLQDIIGDRWYSAVPRSLASIDTDFLRRDGSNATGAFAGKFADDEYLTQVTTTSLFLVEQNPGLTAAVFEYARPPSMIGGGFPTLCHLQNAGPGGSDMTQIATGVEALGRANPPASAEGGHFSIIAQTFQPTHHSRSIVALGEVTFSGVTPLTVNPNTVQGFPGLSVTTTAGSRTPPGGWGATGTASVLAVRNLSNPAGISIGSFVFTGVDTVACTAVNPTAGTIAAGGTFNFTLLVMETISVHDVSIAP